MAKADKKKVKRIKEQIRRLKEEKASYFGNRDVRDNGDDALILQEAFRIDGEVSILRLSL